MAREAFTPPPPCDQSVFTNGKPLLFACTGAVGGAGIFEEWIVQIRQKSGQPVDWHYSGGVAQVLYLGDKHKIIEAARSIPCPGQINVLRWCNPVDAGLYRQGVTGAPDGTIAADWQGDGTSTFYIHSDQSP